MTQSLRLVALKTSPPAFALEQAEGFAREMFGVSGEARQLYGERDQNFRIKTTLGPGIIFKILGPGEDPQAVEFQVGALEHIARMDPSLPVPRVRRTRDGAAYGWVEDEQGTAHMVRALEFQPGKVMDGVEPGRALLRHAGATLARLDRALENFFHPAAGQKIVWDLRAIAQMRPFGALIEDGEARVLVEAVLDRFLNYLPQISRLPHQLVHNDLHPGNMIVAEDERSVTGLLDFGDMIHGPRVFDIAVTAAETVGEGLGALDYAAEVVAGYEGVSRLREGEAEALFECIIARHALSATIHAWRGQNDPEGAAKLGGLSALAVPAIEAYLTAGRDAVVAKFRAAAASGVAPDSEALKARRYQVMGRGLELSYNDPVHFVRGEGVFLYAPDGTRYLDAYNNVPSVGHGNKRVAEAVGAQMATLCSNTRYLHEAVVEYAEALTATMPEGLDRALFVNSGSEANDAAYRIARAVTGKRGAIVIKNAYHGVTELVAALSPYYGAQAQPRMSFVQELEPPDVYRGRFRGEDAAAAYAQDVERAIETLEARKFGVAMLLVDSGFVSHGILDVPGGYFARIAEKVRAAGGIVVGDEVQSGFGRMGEAFWGFERHGVVPDLVTLGKPMANGFPVGAVVAKSALLEAFLSKIEFFSTFGGNPVSAAAAMATLRELQGRGLAENARATGDLLRAELKALRHNAIGDVRGAGLMVGVEITRDGAPDRALARKIANGMRARRVLIGTEGPEGNVLKIRPPLPFAPEHGAMLVDALEKTLREV
ncbi:aminotransferase class III-fold pyridoxal phosphate-dependent enzyme [Acidocella sp.]|uniref:aminotransferase class III-fold pyridoxal phosphate-dependent enzyme n=1 Tax=Acidocella sp. TaxID=50710 RepID=UPI00262D78F6|nr:aminotransferase class III-fold pyridoxal phosphate-dependent enzyme [Acidocella sp.]